MITFDNPFEMFPAEWSIIDKGLAMLFLLSLIVGLRWGMEKTINYVFRSRS